jgi:hypothetical protein
MAMPLNPRGLIAPGTQDPHLFPRENYICLGCHPDYELPETWRMKKFPDETYVRMGAPLRVRSTEEDKVVFRGQVYHHYSPLMRKNLFFTITFYTGLCVSCWHRKYGLTT